MKNIQIDDDLYQFIAANTQQIGESASDILRRLLWENISDKVVQVELQAEKATNAVVEQLVTDEADAVEVEETDPVPATVCENTSVFNVLNKEEVATQKGAVGRFLFILSNLHRAHASNFNSILKIKGRERNYFGLSASELEASGSSIKPKQIPESDYWVTTNNNTPRKKFIIFEVAKQLGYDDTQAEHLRELI